MTCLYCGENLYANISHICRAVGNGTPSAEYWQKRAEKAEAALAEKDIRIAILESEKAAFKKEMGELWKMIIEKDSEAGA